MLYKLINFGQPTHFVTVHTLKRFRAKIRNEDCGYCHALAVTFFIVLAEWLKGLSEAKLTYPCLCLPSILIGINHVQKGRR